MNAGKLFQVKQKYHFVLCFTRSIYAALFASAGNLVSAVDVWGAHVDAINASGLRVEGASGDRRVRIHATTGMSMSSL